MSGAKAAAAQKMANRIYEYSGITGKTTDDLIKIIEDFATDNDLKFDEYYVSEIKRIIQNGPVEVSNETSPIKIADFISTTLFSKAVLDVDKGERKSLRIKFQNRLDSHHAKEVERNKKEQEVLNKKIQEMQESLHKLVVEGSALSDGNTMDQDPEIQSARVTAPPAKQQFNKSASQASGASKQRGKAAAPHTLPRMQDNPSFGDDAGSNAGDEPNGTSAHAGSIVGALQSGLRRVTRSMGKQ